MPRRKRLKKLFNKQRSRLVLLSIIIFVLLTSLFFSYKFYFQKVIKNYSISKKYLDIKKSTFDPQKVGKANSIEPIPDEIKNNCCNHPYFQSVWVAYSKDGTKWESQPNILLDHAGSPAILVEKDRQILYFVDGNTDALGCKIVEGTKLEEGECRIYNFSGTKIWDPKVVALEGYYRMYYVSPGTDSVNTKKKKVRKLTSTIQARFYGFTSIWVSVSFPNTIIANPGIFRAQ